MTQQTVPLWQVAHARTGDKGNRSNISLIAWEPVFYPLVQAQITPARVAEHFAHRKPSQVVRYDLPLIHAFNFVLDDVLDGGVNDALNLDSHGKCLAFHLLALPIEVPAQWTHLLRGESHNAF